MNQMCGGWSETKDATEEIQCICDQVRRPVGGKTNKIYQEFRAVKYRDQVVAGTNYLIKVRVGERNYIHLQVFQALPCHGRHLELSGFQVDKTEDDPLEPIK